ncbi:TolC family outer membrane protein [Palleronia sp. KMU-117]|uniref:TolC family outer membrane protein n=1 Tax=Palleronia sp. KMU-117 TaxID=3434108 RepID=UPI003D75083F
MGRQTYRQWILAAVAAGSLAVAAGSVRAQTLADTLVAAYTNSGLLEQNRALVRAADEDVAQAVARLRPIINYVAEAGYAYSTAIPGGGNVASNFSLAATWLLYDFGQSQLRIDLQKEVVLATREQLLAIEQQVLLRAVAAYVSVLQAAALVDLAENNLRVLGEQLRADTDRFEVGEITRTDVSLTESRVAAALSQLEAARGQFELAREEYRSATGIDATNLAPPPGPPAIPATPDEALAIARQRQPQLRQAQRQVTVAEIGIQLAQASMRPSLNLSARASVDDDFEQSSSLGIQLSGPIYQGGQIASSIRRAQAQRDAARGALINTQFLTDQAVANSYVNLNVANAQITAIDAQVEASRLTLEGAREEQALGARTTLDVLIFEQDLLNAQTDRVTATADRFTAYFQVLTSIGLLTVQNLGLNVPIYDPAAYYNAVRNAPTTYVSPQGEKLDRVLRSIGRN